MVGQSDKHIMVGRFGISRVVAGIVKDIMTMSYHRGILRFDKL